MEEHSAAGPDEAGDVRTEATGYLLGPKHLWRVEADLWGHPIPFYGVQYLQSPKSTGCQ